MLMTLVVLFSRKIYFEFFICARYWPRHFTYPVSPQTSQWFWLEGFVLICILEKETKAPGVT